VRGRRPEPLAWFIDLAPEMSPVRPTCSQPSGATWASSSSGTSIPLPRKLPGDRILTREAHQLAQHDRGADGGGADRSGKPQCLVPVCLDRADVDRAGDERAQGRPRIKRRQAIEPAFVEVADARCEAKAEQVAQAEDVIDRVGGVGRVFADHQLALMVEQAVKDVRGLACIGGDDLAVEQHTGSLP